VTFISLLTPEHLASAPSQPFFPHVEGTHPEAVRLYNGIFHFIGIGGIGMSGIAEVLHRLGYRVQGSDQSESPNTERLTSLGIPVRIGHGRDRVGEAGVVVRSSAVGLDHPEVIQAQSMSIPVISRADMLAELMRLRFSIAVGGSHGKTTTTALIGHVLKGCGMDPTVVNGGVIQNVGTNAYIGKGACMVAEADESDGSFMRLPSSAVVVTNIDPEHMEYYSSFDRLIDAFRLFVERIPFYSFAVLGVDHPVVASLAETITSRRVVTYGLSNAAHLTADRIRTTSEGMRFDVVLRDGRGGVERERAVDVFLPLMGHHNVQNSLAAWAVGLELGCSHEAMRAALGCFSGVKRRFTRLGTIDGMLVVDDYAHHPEEIRVTLETARHLAEAREGRLWVVHQPHRYTRLAHLFEEFSLAFRAADGVWITEVYAANEAPIEGISSDRLVEAIRLVSPGQTVARAEIPEVFDVVRALARPQDVCIAMGAGSISSAVARWFASQPSA
jgi:UDP-N-acetylmuramate--alanine ligase